MVQELAPAPRPRLGALGKVQRRKRIFARLREGASYEEIAGEEGVSPERIRQIVSEVLQSGRSTAAPIMRSCNWIASCRRCSSGPKRSPRAT
jgi:hypothetical protein